MPSPPMRFNILLLIVGIHCCLWGREREMRFVVRAYNGTCKARAGILYLNARCSLETPCLLLTTRKGLPNFITPDLLPSLHADARALLVSPLHFLENPSPSTLTAVGGIHELLSIHDYGVVAVARDSIVCEADAEGSNKLGASFQTSAGRRLVGPVQYMSTVNALRPDVWASLPDEVPAWVSSKRNKLSVDRTLHWLDQCLSIQPANAQNGLGCIVGGLSIEERKRSSQETACRDVAGFTLSGFGLGESIEDRGHLLEAAIGSLPNEKPRHVSGLGMPEEVLQAVSTGIDVIDSTYPYILTMGGYAMIFRYSMEGSSSRKEIVHGNADLGADSTKINLRSVIYRCDVSPILESCRCYTCRKHTKAYINHLLNTHEMLAQTLLEIHNTHHYFNFFGAIRDAVRNDLFPKYRAWFVNQRREANELLLAIA